MAEGGGGGGGEGGGEKNLEFTPTWIVAVVCAVIVIISLIAERFLHSLGKLFKRKNQKPLFEALQKLKEELMLLGFISLLLTVFQGSIQKICIQPSFYRHMLPCKLSEGGTSATAHYRSAFFTGILGGGRRLLAGGEQSARHCAGKGKVPLMSLEAIHQLHIFIFILAVTHVIFSAGTMALASIKIRLWKHWEDAIQKEITRGNDPPRITHVGRSDFIRNRFRGIGTDSKIISWLHSFLKQFYGSVTKSDYRTMRLGFINEHFKSNHKFNFHKYMVRALESDFKKVVGITWYLWIVVILYLLLNVHGWHVYFWISLVPVVLLLAVGTKLEHVITQLAHEVAEKHTAIVGDLVIDPSDKHFWFNRPRLVLYLIHFILFQSAFEVAIFFWILTTYGFNSCIMDKVGYIIARLVLSIIIPIVCSYSTLPLYAIVTQMGDSFKKDIFEEHVQQGLVGWAQQAKKRKGQKVDNGESVTKDKESVNQSSPKEVQLQEIVHDNPAAVEEGTARLLLQRMRDHADQQSSGQN